MSSAGVKKQNNRRGVLICGAYGMGNAGDEAILDAIVAEMRSIDPDMPITVLSRDPDGAAERLGVRALHTFNFPGFLREMRRRRLYINGGGSLIQDVTSTRSLLYYLYTIVAARHRGCRVQMYGCGIGPVTRRLNRRLAGAVMDRYVDAITLREENSLRELRSFGVTRPEAIVASDPALSIPPAPPEEIDEAMKKAGLEPGGRYLCLCLRRWPGFEAKAELFARAADYAYERHGLVPVLLSVNHRQDGWASGLAESFMRSPHFTVPDPMPTPLASGFISRMSLVLSMRLHGLIFAAGNAVPLAGVSYDPKVASFLDYIHQDNYVDFDALERPEQLYDLVDAAVAADAQALRDNTRRIMEIENLNTRAARRLLED